jgi:hypothetical protein
VKQQVYTHPAPLLQATQFVIQEKFRNNWAEITKMHGFLERGIELLST